MPKLIFFRICLLVKKFNFLFFLDAADSCGDLPEVQNGVFTNGTFDVGSYRLMGCSGGNLHGYSGVVCKENGQWSEPGRCMA